MKKWDQLCSGCLAIIKKQQQQTNIISTAKIKSKNLQYPPLLYKLN